jgi:hypothetical protein
MAIFVMWLLHRGTPSALLSTNVVAPKYRQNWRRMEYQSAYQDAASYPSEQPLPPPIYG